MSNYNTLHTLIALQQQLHAHQHGSPEQEARSSVVNVMQGVTQQLEQTEQSEEEECQVFKCALCTD